MKIKNLLTICGVAAALMLSADNIFAQIDNGGGGGNGGDQGNGNNGGGQRRNRNGGPGGNFDPAQMQQRMVEGALDRLDITNDTERAAVQPLVSKVIEAERDARGAQMRGMFGGRNRGGQGGQGGGNRPNFGGQPDPAAEALQKAIDDGAPSSQIKDLLAKYKSAQKEKQSKVIAAQKDLRAVLTVKQEAQATLLGLLE